MKLTIQQLIIWIFIYYNLESYLFISTSSQCSSCTSPLFLPTIQLQFITYHEINTIFRRKGRQQKCPCWFNAIFIFNVYGLRSNGNRRVLRFCYEKLKQYRKIIIFQFGDMCYLKDVMLEQNLDINSFEFKEEQSGETIAVNSFPLLPQVQKHKVSFLNPESQLISKLIESISRNNNLISKINSSISPISQQVEKITINFENKRPRSCHELTPQSPTAASLQKFHQDHDSIYHRLFGNKNYKYALQATHQLQDTIYKERNFSIGVKLVDSNGKNVQNCNLLTLCFTMCTTEGEWILENRMGHPLIKGKTQRDLYRGQAQFEKIYAREVSRIYPNGKVVIVIYPKPSSIKYFAEGASQQCVDSEQIMPLIIQNITIRAKRKQ